MPFSTATPAPWQARLELGFERRGERCVLVQRVHEGPIRVQKALHPEGDAVCQAIIVHPPAGIAGGDALAIHAHAAPGSHAQLCTPGATRWYRSAGPPAAQEVLLDVARGAVLEWLPMENILYSGARARLDCRVRLAEQAAFVGWETLCFGRPAAGESFDHGELRLGMRIEREGVPLWIERGLIEAGSPLLASPIGLDGHSVSATLVAAGPDIARASLDACRGIATPEAGALSGITALPGLLLARYLGASGEAARNWMERIWSIIRPEICGRTAVAPRIWRT